MGTKTESKQVRAEKRRQRQRARAERRRADRALVPVAVAQRLGIRVAMLADAMRTGGITTAITQTQAQQWVADPEAAPEWLVQLRGERLAGAAQAEYRRHREAERQELRELAAEQSALAKLKAAKRRFSDDEWVWVQDWAFRAAKDLVRGWGEFEVTEFDRHVLRAVGVGADNHHTWPVHAGGCDGVGPEHCVVRMEQLRAVRRADALIDSVAKETALRGLALTPGQFVTTWHGARVGRVVRVNKVSVKVRMIGVRGDRHEVVEKNLDPRYVERAAPSLPAPPNLGVEVVLRDYGGHIRRAQVVELDGPLFEATYSLKSGLWRSGWFDVAALHTAEMGSGSP
jgi:hypothetical protein